jgi:hypothetical protein
MAGEFLVSAESRLDLEPTQTPVSFLGGDVNYVLLPKNYGLETVELYFFTKTSADSGLQ